MTDLRACRNYTDLISRQTSYNYPLEQGFVSTKLKSSLQNYIMNSLVVMVYPLDEYHDLFTVALFPFIFRRSTLDMIFYEQLGIRHLTLRGTWSMLPVFSGVRVALSLCTCYVGYLYPLVCESIFRVQLLSLY